MTWAGFIKVLREATSDISPETRSRLGRDLEEVLKWCPSFTEAGEYPKFIGVGHGGKKQTLLSLSYFPPSLHGVEEKDFDRHLEAVEGTPEYLDQMQRLMSHVYMGTMEMKSGNTDPYCYRKGVLRHNQYSSSADFSRHTPLLVIGEDVANHGRTTAVDALTNTFMRRYPDRLNADQVAVQTSTDLSTYGFPNVSGLRLLYDPVTYELLLPASDWVPQGPIGYLSRPELRYFADILVPHVKRIAGTASSVRNDIPDLARRAGATIPPPLIINTGPRFLSPLIPKYRTSMIGVG